MKLSCTLENFKKAIYNTERVIGKQITLPILENILLETEKGMLRISATNLEIGVFMKIGAKVEKEGKITIPAKLLSNFVNNLPAEGNISLELEGQILTVKSGKQAAKIKGLLAQDFPIIPEMESPFLFSWNANEIKEVLPKMLVSASVDTTRPELSGINIILGEMDTQLASTDSFRLAEALVAIKPENPKEYGIFRGKVASVIVPANTFSEVWRAIDPGTEEVKVSIEENQIFFQVDGVRIVSRLINGKYPEYQQIIPQKFETATLVNKEEILRSTRIASFFTQSKSGEVTFRFAPQKGVLAVSAQAEDKGENSAEIALEGTGNDQEVVFNPRYILDGLNAISSPVVAILINNGSSPVALRATTGEKKETDGRFTYIIMPIRK